MHVLSRKEARTNELYSSLPAEVLHQLEQHEQTATVSQGTRLIEHGLVPEHLVILNSGSAEVSLPADGKDLLLGTAFEGKVLGMRSVISGEVPEIDATCLEDCCVTLVPRADFLDILQRNPQTYFAIAKVLSSDLRMADQLVRRYSRRSLKLLQRPSTFEAV